MSSISEKQRIRAANDRKTDIINALYRMGIYATADGRSLEECTLYTLEYFYIDVKFRRKLDK